MTCLGFSVWWRYRAQWGALKQFEGTVHGAHGKPLQIAGRTQHLDIQWGEARGRASFIVIVGLESLSCLIGMDIMQQLCVHIDVTNGTATPAQPDPQKVHLNAAQCRYLEPDYALPRPLIHLQLSHNGVRGRYQRLAHQPWGPLLHPKFKQPREEIPLPRAQLSPMGAADSSLIQPQRKEMPLPGAGMSAPPITKIPCPATASPGELLLAAPLSTAPQPPDGASPASLGADYWRPRGGDPS